MPSFRKLLTDFARSPKGRQLADQARQALEKPENQRRIRELRDRLTNTNRRGGS